jgi:hypothetical protein
MTETKDTGNFTRPWLSHLGPILGMLPLLCSAEQARVPKPQPPAPAVHPLQCSPPSLDHWAAEKIRRGAPVHVDGMPEAAGCGEIAEGAIRERKGGWERGKRGGRGKEDGEREGAREGARERQRDSTERRGSTKTEGQSACQPASKTRNVDEN